MMMIMMMINIVLNQNLKQIFADTGDNVKGQKATLRWVAWWQILDRE